ncbi:carboxypeptidase-like regulatory domain-containing protein [Mucilaginibacter conchicola]|uniref:Carboxypeptidase-like regulatory domain-containing protein n=1 Tax=Mucilaginibacter conchicola TaxID=2303333 RepID=A0A372NS75_9SPHI|nr:carboxypeptidase-like regulatory domain-containing protein [Mucilaginibacter conchicola]RFZ91761.1 carboxypeptidase-like regulatory domain-containing protein [Mucilaginibacter conchicola]
MMKPFLFLLMLFPGWCFAQININGKVSDGVTQKPVADASVFLSNATVGDKSNAEGLFKLQQVRPGKYELVVTVVGYETYRQNVAVENKNIELQNIMLVPKTTQLKEVTIMPNKDWEMYYAMFKREFLGESEVAKQCKILNPDVVDLEYDKKARQLTASSADFIEVENKVLGYKVKYLLNKFIKDNKTGWTYFEGSTLYEPMTGSDRQQRKWLKKRREVFDGSNMHFLRAVLSNTVKESGFEVMRLIRKPNPAYQPGSLKDKYIQTLVNQPLKTEEFTSITDKRGTFALNFNDCLYVMYTKRNDLQPDRSLQKPLTAPNYETSIASFTDEYPLFDYNGVIENPASLIFEGHWGKNRVAEMLPVDYMPEQSK